MAKGFPQRGILEAIRDRLRDALQAVGLGHGVDDRYRSRGAHVTLARFKEAADLSAVVACLNELGDAELGQMTVREAQLVINDFYMSEEKIEIAAVIPLGSG